MAGAVSEVNAAQNLVYMHLFFYQIVTSSIATVKNEKLERIKAGQQKSVSGANGVTYFITY